MLHLIARRLIPAPLHRVLYRLAYTVRRKWWQVRPPRRGSVVVVAFDAGGRVLLVRHSYGPRLWSLPGGGMDRGEDATRTAAREMREELGCGLSNIVALDAGAARAVGSPAHRHVLAARLVGVPVPDRREIVAVVLADPANLPAPCGSSTRHWVARAAALGEGPRAASQER